MTTLYLVRHAESVANADNLLAGRIDYPLSPTGKLDAAAIATEFAAKIDVDLIWCSPLLRAQQTAAPFLVACNAPLRIDERIQEQHMGRFSGKSYAEVESDPGYCHDRTARWDWVPDGGGESYRMIAERVASFLVDLPARCIDQVSCGDLVVLSEALSLALENRQACLSFRITQRKTPPRVGWRFGVRPWR